MSLGTAPSFFILDNGDNPSTVKWSRKDKLIYRAVLQLEAEKCPDCGIPVWHGHSSSNEVEFKVKWGICHGCAAKAEAKKDVEMAPGEYAGVTAVGPDGESPVTLSREEGYKTWETVLKSKTAKS